MGHPHSYINPHGTFSFYVTDTLADLPNPVQATTNVVRTQLDEFGPGQHAVYIGGLRAGVAIDDQAEDCIFKRLDQLGPGEHSVDVHGVTFKFAVTLDPDGHFYATYEGRV